VTVADNKQTVRSVMTAVYDEHDPDAVERSVATSLIQHGSLAADGVDGLKAFVAGLRANASQELHRAFAEGDFVVTHATYDGVLDVPSVGFELWRLQDGLVVEHWDVMTPEPAPLPHDNGLY
jgi:predicted SnoaL-like aldol condensation-catalyzing enzyme